MAFNFIDPINLSDQAGNAVNFLVTVVEAFFRYFLDPVNHGLNIAFQSRQWCPDFMCDVRGKAVTNLLLALELPRQFIYGIQEDVNFLNPCFLNRQLTVVTLRNFRRKILYSDDW